jgi:hypothetical protein
MLLVFSSLLGNFLLAKDASAGGMDVEWKIPLPNGFQKMLVVSDGSILVADEKGTIQEIGLDGTVRWAFNSSHPDDLVLGASDRLYFIERSLDQDTVECLYPNGTVFWSMVSDVPVSELRLGQNGDVYLVEQRNNYSCLVCLNGDGFYKWIYAPEGGLNNFLLLDDGTVIARNTVSVWNATYNVFGGVVTISDNLTAISDDGTILWERDILENTNPALEYLAGPFFGPNSTIDLRLTHTNGSMNITEFDLDGRNVPVVQGDQFSRYSCIQGKVILVIDNWQQPSPDGGFQVYSRITAWNADTGVLNWQRVQKGWASIYDSTSENGTVIWMNGSISQIGPAGETVCSVTDAQRQWNVLGYDENGFLLTDDHSTITRTGVNGDPIWKLGFDSRVEAGSLGPKGEIIVATSDYVVSIHKPVLSTTMNYFVVLLAIDLFVTLMYVVSIVDRMWPRSSARTE